MDSILLTITDGLIVSANPAACETFRMTEKEISDAGQFGIVVMADPRLRLSLEERHFNDKAKGKIAFIRKMAASFPENLPHP